VVTLVAAEVMRIYLGLWYLTRWLLKLFMYCKAHP